LRGTPVRIVDVHYPVDRARTARQGILAVIAAFVITVTLLMIVADDGPSATGADFVAATSTTDPTPAIVPVAAPPTTPAPSTTTPTTPTTTTTLPPTTAPTTTAVPTTTLWPTDTLPEQPTGPIDAPLDAEADEPVIQLGGITIPKIGLDAPMFEGIRLSTLDRGPGHWPGTAMPGEIGNAVIAAHRVSHQAHFRNIDQLVPGDEVYFTTTAGISTYRVTGVEIVDPSAVWIVDQTPTATATLFACHPPGSVRQRIVVHLELVT
jgi:sortase A